MRSKEVDDAIDNFNFFNEGEYITREMAESKDTVLNYISELEEENLTQRSQINSAFDNGFIHKDKIRDKIKELDKLLKDRKIYIRLLTKTDREEIRRQSDYINELRKNIQVLQELLGE